VLQPHNIQDILLPMFTVFNDHYPGKLSLAGSPVFFFHLF